MSVRNILVAYNGGLSSSLALDFALDLAKKNDAYVTALLAHAAKENYASMSHFIPKEAQDIIEASNKDIVTSAQNTFKAKAESLNLGDKLEFVTAQGSVDEILARAARNFDVIVIGDVHDDQVDAHLAFHPDLIALRAGKPVLIVPDDYEVGQKTSSAVVAWDGTRSCARALSDAIPMLETDGEVTLLTVGESKLPRPVEETLTHLKRHEIKATHVHLENTTNVASAILGYCDSNHPNLLVMGAYEHSKFRVDLMGGLTNEILKKARVPVLLSH